MSLLQTATTPERLRRVRRRRYLTDKLAKWSITGGGLSVIGAILLIFFYLLYEVMPLFQGATIQREAEFAASGTSAAPLLLTLDEHGGVAMRLDAQGKVAFFAADSGAPVKDIQLPVPAGVKILSVASVPAEAPVFAVGLSDGTAIVAHYDFRISYGENNRRVVDGVISYPYGEAPLKISDTGLALETLAIRDSESALVITAGLPGNRIGVAKFVKKVDFETDETTLERQYFALPALGDSTIRQLLLSPDMRMLYVLQGKNELVVLDVRAPKQGLADTLIDREWLVSGGSIDRIEFLLGSISLLAATDKGDISQWMLVRTDEGGSQHWDLRQVRTFEAAAPHKVTAILAEHRRKGFVSIDSQGELGLFNATSHRTALREQITQGAVDAAAISPRANRLLVEADGRFALWSIENEHPEVSWSALWSKVWYEGYSEPQYIWQSSASNNDFEPKLSLVPLVFGTLKAAFYAMLVATPIAVCGAIFTANFMVPSMRRKVKPLIETMAALPSVILGFFAGLWLAPFLEKNLAGVFGIFLLMPPAVLLAAFIWSRLPQEIRLRVPSGWEGAILIPVVLFTGWACIQLGAVVEMMMFGGDMRSWLTNDAGIAFDQRNALVVGIAMGIAVAPIIFSIAEDAIFSVPKHLVFGSLALGATPWQTLIGVVLPTASPGIFSALMIGLGRAVGETMIVLMATGNTPVMEWSIFEGLRTLAANIAVEVPEAEVDSTHYRVLFLAAMVLFMFTFMVNTAAEVIRQRLRTRYGNL